MDELISEAFAFVNLPFTVLLCLMALYWTMVIFGALDANFGSDLDVDGGIDGTLDTHTHGDLHGQAHGGPDHEGADHHHDGRFFSGLAHFVNLGDVPLMVVVSVITLCVWTFSLLANRYVTGHDVLIALALMVPNLVVSILLTRYITMPVKPLFRMLRSSEENDVKIVGKSCLILTSQATPTSGQAEIATAGSPLLINVRTQNGEILPKGSLALIISEDRERDVYFIVEFPAPTFS